MKKHKILVSLLIFTIISSFLTSYVSVFASQYDTYINGYPVTKYTEDINTQTDISSLSDGQVEVKKSVKYNDDGSFDITLLTEGKKYDTTGINEDAEYNIEIVLDNSGSMYNAAERIVNAVNAINATIRKYSSNPKINIGVVAFSGVGNGYCTENTTVMLNLGHYTSTSSSDVYLTSKNGYGAADGKSDDGTPWAEREGSRYLYVKTSQNGSEYDKYIHPGSTYIQAGIVAGLEQLSNAKNKDVAKPIMLILTDGSSNMYTYTNDKLTGYQYEVNTIDELTNKYSTYHNSDIHKTNSIPGYVAIRQAIYAKQKLSSEYSREAVIYTMGFDLDKTADDYWYSIATINPTKTNVDKLSNFMNSGYSQYGVYSLLNNSGLTQSQIQYNNGYSDGSSSTDITNYLDSILSEKTKVENSAVLSSGNLKVTDEIDEGYEINSTDNTISMKVELNNEEKSIVATSTDGNIYSYSDKYINVSYNKATKNVEFEVVGSYYLNKSANLTFTVTPKEDLEADINGTTYNTNNNASYVFSTKSNNPKYKGANVNENLDNTGSITLTKIPAKMIVNHIDKFTGTVLEKEEITGYIKDEKQTEAKNIEGYILESKPENEKYILTEEVQEANYYYIKQSNVVVKYVDENTGAEIPGVDEVTTTYKQGESYTTEKKDISGYTYTKDTGNTAGTIADKDIEVVYYYKKTSAGVVTKHIDTVTKKEIAKSTTQTGLENDSYTTSPVTIDGYVLEVTPANATGKMTPEQITVTYEYRKLSNVIVKYIDENTGAEIADKVSTTYKQGQSYTTEKKTIDGYTFTKDTGNTTGTVQDKDIEVIYYYKKNSAGVVTKHIDTVTKKEIAKSTTQTGLENEEYTTSPATIDGYVLEITPANATGKFSTSEIVVTYEYRKQSKVIVKYVDENTGAEIADKVSTTYKQEQNYTTEKKAIDGYKYTKDTGNVAGTVERENIEVVYYYKKNTKVVVKYIDEVTKEEIIDSVEIIGLEKDPYETEEKEKAGYELVGVDGNTTGKMTVNTIEVTYKYRKNANLITKHIDKNSGEKIVEDVVKKYKEGDKYEALPQNIAGYVLVESPEETTGTMGREDVEKTFYYKKISGGLVVKYVDKITNELLDIEEYTGNENDLITFDEKTFLHYVIYSRPDVSESRLTPEAQEYTYYYLREAKVNVRGIDQDTKEVLYETTMSGLEGNEYTTEPRKVDGYELVKIPQNKDGVYSRNTQDVVYEYKKISLGVTVKYLDKETGKEIADEERITGYVGDTYQTEKKEIEDYNFVEVKGDAIGSLEAEEKEVIYYYEKKTGKVEVIYEDREGNVLLKEEMTGKVREKYKVEEKEIKNYEVIERPEKTEGEYEEGTIILKYILDKKQGRITVNFVDKEGNKLAESITTEGYIEEKYELEVPEIEGYKVIKNGQIKTEYTEDEQIIDVVYDKEDVPQTGDVDIFSNLVMIIVCTFIIINIYNKKYKNFKN